MLKVYCEHGALSSDLRTLQLEALVGSCLRSRLTRCYSLAGLADVSLRSESQCRGCGMRTPFRMKEQSPREKPVIPAMALSGTSRRRGRTSRLNVCSSG